MVLHYAFLPKVILTDCYYIIIILLLCDDRDEGLGLRFVGIQWCKIVNMSDSLSRLMGSTSCYITIV